jgi:hypothetical protein
MRFVRCTVALYLACAGAHAARAAEPWADAKLPVTDGLALWLDAARPEAAHAANKSNPPADGTLPVWFDGSGNGRHLRQGAAAARPRVVRVGAAAVVRFDGESAHLRFTGGKGELKAFTAFVVAAPRANPGDFRGLLALNAPDGRDYETGLTLDLGPGATPRFTQLNVEGRGFGGWRNLVTTGGDFGKLCQIAGTFWRFGGSGTGWRRARGRGRTPRCRSPR